MMADSPVAFPKEGPIPAKYPPDVTDTAEPAEKDYYIFSSPCRSLAQIATIQSQMPAGEFASPANDWQYLDITTPWAEYIRSTKLHPHLFYRDVVHANEAGEQILGKIIMAFWTVEEPWLPQRLAWFQDQKFGFMMHWAPYSQWGCIESWPLVEEDKWGRPDDLKAWTDRDRDMARFTRDYWALPKTFNPVKFNPRAWASTAKGAGMKYVVFTTKHHEIHP